jgi:RHS repeat-associated protein
VVLAATPLLCSAISILSSSWNVLGFNSGTNRISDSGWGYDGAGNINQAPGSNQMTYDAEERMTSLAGITYKYDGAGNRVEQIDPGGAVTVFVYDAFGNLAAEYTTSTATPAAQGTQYLIADQLGSTRMVMGASFERHDYTPFGVEAPVSQTWRAGVTGYGADSLVRWRFAGQERDSSSGLYTGLYHFPARYMSPDQGRFWSVDPGNAGAAMGDPQSWNGYLYVGNNPMAYVDPDGRQFVIAFLSFGEDAGDPIAAGLTLLAGLLSDVFFGGGGQTPTFSVTTTAKPVPQPAVVSNPGALGMPVFFAQATASAPNNGPQKACSASSASGNATYYNLVGNRTASGQPFDPTTMNAAMYQPGFPMGSVVSVQLQNDPQQFVTVTVNDTGPFARGSDGRALIPLRADPNIVIDLTPTAFTALNGSLRAGRVPATVTKCP